MSSTIPNRLHSKFNTLRQTVFVQFHSLIILALCNFIGFHSSCYTAQQNKLPPTLASLTTIMLTSRCVVLALPFQLLLILHILHNNNYYSPTPTPTAPTIHPFDDQDLYHHNILNPYTIRRTASQSFWNSSAEMPIAFNFFFRDYLTFHTNNRNTAKRLVFRPHGSGLGDRFNCLVYVYWAAVLSQRIFLVEWDHPLPLKHFLVQAQPNTSLFFHKQNENLTNIQLLGSTKSEHDRYQSVLLSDTHTVIIHSNKIPPHMPVHFLSRNTPKQLSPELVRRLQADENFKRAILHRVFTWNNALVEQHHAHALVQQLLPLDGRYIAVHARLGFGVNETSSRFEQVGNNMKVVANCLASRAIHLSYMCANPALPIFLATDTPQFRQIFKTTVQQASRGRVHVLTAQWNVIHSAVLPKHSRERIGFNEQDAVAAIKASYLDLFFLGHSQHIVSLYSSFPRLAFALGNANSLTELRNMICLDVEQW